VREQGLQNWRGELSNQILRRGKLHQLEQQRGIRLGLFGGFCAIPIAQMEIMALPAAGITPHPIANTFIGLLQNKSV
jgi:hypothetical protein